MSTLPYCASRLRTIRRPAVNVDIGSVGVGGSHPIRVQSMTTSDTQDVAATVRQCIALAEVGCEIVRVTAPNVAAAQALRPIREQFSAAGFAHVPLVADIHFLPSAAMEAVEHVEKVRVNPGNYADKKKFAVREYSDADYDSELQRLHDAFTPLVVRARTLGRTLRIGTNHGSLSDRIMNRYGDSALGMVESALEFVRICESHGFHAIVLSMKSSNPKVMIQAYRLLAARMDAAHRAYPLHLGVTEAGDGEDGRIKSAIGIGSLLFDGLGDTIRVSLTEDSVYEIPVAQAIAARAMAQWGDGARKPEAGGQRSEVRSQRSEVGGQRAEMGGQSPAPTLSDPFVPSVSSLLAPPPVLAPPPEHLDPFSYVRRETAPLTLAPGLVAGGENPPRVIVRVASVSALPAAARALTSSTLADTPAEVLLVPLTSVADLAALSAAAASLPAAALALELAASLTPADLAPLASASRAPLIYVRAFATGDEAALTAWAALARAHGHTLAVATTATDLTALAPTLRALDGTPLLLTAHPRTDAPPESHALGAYRQLAAAAHLAGLRAPLWMRNTTVTRFGAPDDTSFLGRLLDAAILSGALLCDGLGDLVSIETETDVTRATKLAYNVLQGSGARISKTEFVACPSCGRTLFDLQSTTQRIRAQTGHLKGVKLAIMGCIVNGPGEMADADFGYVGGAPGKINLYVGKTCVQYNIPQAEADARLIALIKEHGKWFDPVPVAGG